MKKVFIELIITIILISLVKMGFSPRTEELPLQIEDMPIESTIEENEIEVSLIYPAGETIEERFLEPEGFKRVSFEEGSFGDYLRSFPLKPHGSEVHYYDGRIKRRDNVHEAVLDIDVGDRDLQQCADAAMRLRAEYLYKKGRYDDISFEFTNGFNAEYGKWRRGQRIVVEGNNVYWVNRTEPTDDYNSFRSYLNMVFAYAGTLSLSRELLPIEIRDLSIGDVIIQGGSPGHAVIVFDIAINRDTGERVYLLGQSYMPAQEIHILKNPADSSISPWYRIDENNILLTPEWTFKEVKAMRFH